MELKIVNPDGELFQDQFGIPEERINELGNQLDELTDKFRQQGMVKVCDVFNEIAKLCNTPEEYTFCVVSHCNYMAIVHGRFFCPPKPKPNPSKLN